MAKDKKKIKLGDLKKEDVFHVPDKYFEKLPAKIESRIEQTSTGGSAKTISIYRKIGYAAAAAVVLMVMWVGGVYESRVENPSADLLADVSNEDLVAYLMTEDLEWIEIVESSPEAMRTDSDPDIFLPSLDESTEESLYEQYGITPEDTL